MANQFNILDYTDGPLLKTGQTTDYTPAGRTTKDDGGFQRGLAGSKADNQYHILTSGQYSGTTNITVNGFTEAHTNECVQDKVTGLMWSRTHSTLIYGPGTQGLLWDDTAGANEDIFEYCDQANISALAGFSDWRVSNIYELYSLVSIESPTGEPNLTAFPVWTSSNIYSSSTRPSNSVSALMVSFSSGNVTLGTKTSTRERTALCRLGIEQ